MPGVAPLEENQSNRGRLPQSPHSEDALSSLRDRLSAASPAERGAILLSLPELRDGVELPGLPLRGALLSNANLRQARLPHADLRFADLKGAALGGADFRGADLGEVQMANADLANANLQGAILDGSQLAGALLEEADLRQASLRFADLANTALEGANLQDVDFWGATLTDAAIGHAHLQRVKLNEANLSGADLSGSLLCHATLQHTNLSQANLQGVDLQGASLRQVNLAQAVLRDARLEGVDLTACDLRHVHWSGAWLERTRLGREQLGESIGEELKGEYEAAGRAYLALERNFAQLGDPDAESWAYRKRRRMQKRAALRRGRFALRARQYRMAAKGFAEYATSQVVQWICDYGESIGRVLLALVVVYFTFAVLYGVTGGVLREVKVNGATVRQPTRQPLDLAVFSLLAMTTSGSPAINLFPKDTEIQLLAAVQAFLGIILTGLLGFVIGHRIRR